METDLPFVAEVAVGKTWGDCEVVWEGLLHDRLTEEDEEALKTGGAAPRFAYFEQEAGVRVQEEEPVPASASAPAAEGRAPGVTNALGALPRPGGRYGMEIVRGTVSW